MRHEQHRMLEWLTAEESSIVPMPEKKGDA